MAWQQQEKLVESSPVNLALSRPPFEGELSKGKGKGRDRDGKEKEAILLGGAGFQKAMQTLTAQPKMEDASSSKLLAKQDGASKDLLYLLR